MEQFTGLNIITIYCFLIKSNVFILHSETIKHIHKSFFTVSNHNGYLSRPAWGMHSCYSSAVTIIPSDRWRLKESPEIISYCYHHGIYSYLSLSLIKMTIKKIPLKMEKYHFIGTIHFSFKCLNWIYFKRFLEWINQGIFLHRRKFKFKLKVNLT